MEIKINAPFKYTLSRVLVTLPYSNYSKSTLDFIKEYEKDIIARLLKYFAYSYSLVEPIDEEQLKKELYSQTSIDYLNNTYFYDTTNYKKHRY